jgi:hypothetical protein
MLKQTLAIMEAEWGMQPIRPAGMPDGLPFALFAFQDDGFRMLLTVTWDESKSLLIFDAEPGDGTVADAAKPTALALMNDVNAALDVGRFEMRGTGDKLKIHCRAAAIVVDEPTPDLIRALVKDSLTGLNSVKGLVQHDPGM